MAELTVVTSIAGPLALDTASTGASGRKRYRRVIALELPLDGAEGARIDLAGAVLRGGFRAREFEVRSSGGVDLHATVTSAAGGAVVELEGRFAVRRIEVVGTVTGPLTLHRLDGGTAADATVSATLSGQGADFPSSGASEFFDVRFAVRATGGLAGASSVRRIVARGYPTGPRLGLADPSDLEDVDFFFQAAGEQRNELSVNAGAPLAQALSRFIADRPLADPTRVSLVIESDVPCEFEFTGGAAGLSATYAPRTGAFADAATKRVLRFSESVGFRHEVPVRVPEGASIAKAALRVLPSFRRTIVESTGSPAVTEVPSASSGALFDGSRWLGRSLSREDAVAGSLSGVALAVTALSPGTVIHAELHDDAAGQPSGRVLAQGALEVPRAGTPLWVTWTFAEPELPGALWLVVSARQGTGIWLSESADDAPAAFVLSRDQELGPFRLLRTLSRRRLLLRALQTPSSASPGEGSPLGAPFSLSVGDHAVHTPAESDETGSIRLDFTAALRAFQASDSAGDETPLVFSSALTGILTVYPPDIELE